MSETDFLKEISKKLDNVLKLLAIIAVRGIETEQGKIELLDQLGFRPVEIANFLSKSPHNISVQLNKMRKKKEKTVNTKVTEQSSADEKQREAPTLTDETMEKS